ncbi:MAG: hypothetical protein H6737_02825 [Alphaproteobacteria bacterium]|nr:hypothetical protein [Alphaproteobacteria bacterium]
MKLHSLALLGLPLVLFGCPTGDDDTDLPTDTGDTDTVDTDDTDTDETDTDVPQLTVTVTLTDNPDTMIIAITNGTEDYSFGYAQTEVIANGGLGWTGEDCHNGQGTTQICHPVGQTGLTLTHVDTIPEVVAGSTMLLSVDSPPESTPENTYILIGDATDACWVWGHDITYYDDFIDGPCTAYTAPM